MLFAIEPYVYGPFIAAPTTSTRRFPFRAFPPYLCFSLSLSLFHGWPGDHKYTNNWGWINPGAPRHTPQAFSHFTWCYSQGRLLVADVQGVPRPGPVTSHRPSYISLQGYI